jgi:hypothetical protein
VFPLSRTINLGNTSHRKFLRSSILVGINGNWWRRRGKMREVRRATVTRGGDAAPMGRLARNAMKTDVSIKAKLHLGLCWWRGWSATRGASFCCIRRPWRVSCVTSDTPQIHLKDALVDATSDALRTYRPAHSATEYICFDLFMSECGYRPTRFVHMGWGNFNGQAHLAAWPSAFVCPDHVDLFFYFN